MKLLFDQNISYKIVSLLASNYSVVTTVKSENLIDALDRQIWEFAKKNDFIIVTQDSDFNDLTQLLGFPPKVIWIRTGNLTTQQIAEIFNQKIDEIENFSKDNEHGCLEIFSVGKK